MYYVYILKSKKNDRYYIGFTGNLERRLEEHNLGKTRGNKYFAPFEIVYKEEFDTLLNAVRREKYIKSQKSRKFIEKLINRSVA